jgi:hypothetical protein
MVWGIKRKVQSMSSLVMEAPKKKLVLVNIDGVYVHVHIAPFDPEGKEWSRYAAKVEARRVHRIQNR